ncbi:TPA: hypothetical protein DD449_03720 [Candidatus Berkelbacteria bacterium]|uniref:Glycosyltransferase RgtA/B/C/D-like domain-containing protein n=1 Tax=Berkelbacteria bacterium GW2011_GWE1_39_12 TaxID=1618337 RepID=A0A0G4B422_9BACT|nr:MAG: hypothetical protein UT28_C0001G0380 [Berkelbacteria bacterium GW2011_GWE1_39_12]HBO60765.1 hypothetical protein [Candidatus Berkelbacteria bacterium]
MKITLPKLKFKISETVKDALSITLLFLAWRGALFLVAYFGYFDIAPANGNYLIKEIHPAISMWLVYDYGWFKDIVAKSYDFSRHSMAFFPLWPATIWLFSKIFYFVNTHIIAFVLANLITLADCWIFYKLVQLDYDKDTAYRSVKYFLFFPMSLFLASAYSEPLFLLGVLSSFYFIRKQQYLLSGFGGIIASASRLVGSIMLLPLVIEVIKQKITKENWWKTLGILIAPLGLLGYMYFLKTNYGDCLGFLHAYQNSDWNRGYGYNAFNLFWNDIKIIFSFHGFGPSKDYVDAMMTTGSVLVMLTVLLSNIKKIRLSYFVYAILIMLVPLFSNSLDSLNRYVLPIFPFFMVLGILGRRKWVDSLITVTFLVLLGLFTVMFINRWWVG